MLDDTSPDDDSIFVGLFPNLHRLSHWCDTDTDNFFENSGTETARRLDGYDDGFGMLVTNYGASVRGLCVYKAWHLCNVRFYYRYDGGCFAVAAIL